MAIIALLLAVGLFELILAAIVLRTSPNRQNLYFGTFVFSAVIWGLGAALMLFSSSHGAIKAGSILFLVAPLYTTLFVLYFSYIFAEKKRLTLIYSLLLAVPPIIFTVISIYRPSTFITLQQISSSENLLKARKLAYFIYALYFSTYLSSGVLILEKKFHKAAGRLRTQIAYSTVAISVTGAISFATNLLLPLLGNMHYVWVGPLSSILFVALIFVAIIKHRLFDIRLVVARALAYSLSIGVLLGGYAVLFYVAINSLSDKLAGGWKTAVNLVLIVIAAATYGPLKHYFDRLTNRLFYRDAYDPQVFLDELNQALVANLDLNKLLSDAAAVIVSNLKAGWCVFGVKETNFRGIRIIGTSQKSFQPEEIAAVRAITPHLDSNIVVVDNLPPEQTKLKQLLAKNDIALLARLVPSSHKTEEGVGYIVLGAKKSGNPYSAADERIIDIIASELLIAIQNSLHFEEIQNFNLTLQQKVDDATREVKHANERLKQLDETKDDFISMASHQLRTPLTSVKGYLSLILDGDVGRITAQQRKMLSQAYTSSQRMVYLIADLLNVSRLKTGKFAIEPTPINLAEVVAEEMEQLVGAAKGKDLKMTYIKPSTFPTLMLDETKTRQVIMNFVDNAIYYTPPGGTIDVKLTETPHAIEFRVIDNGIGVPASERYHLFTKFYRAKNAQKARPDGTGLGLFMAKKVIIGEGGSIIFDSEENRGSTFGFSFSKAKLAVKPPPTVSAAVSKKMPSKTEEAAKQPVS